jgi:carbon monoxide dehydrogenase subunit G
MITVEKAVMVNRAPEDVFEFLADVRNEERWNPNVVRIETESGGPLVVGGTFEGVYRRGGQMRFELVEAVAPSRLVFFDGGRQLRLTAPLELRRVGSTTCVRMKGEMEPRGPVKLLAPLMRKAIERQYERVTESFQQVVEEDARTPS